MPVLDIKVNVPLDKTKKSSSRRSTPNYSSKKDEDKLGRRRGKSGAINFYDLGQIKDGSSWIDTNFQLPKTPIFGLGDAAPQPLITEDYEGKNASILAIPPETLLGTTRKITKGTLSEKYQVLVIFDEFVNELDDLEQWTNDGLKVTQEELSDGLLVAANGPPFFEIAMLKDGESNQKITSLPDYNSDPVSFTPSPKMDVFLIPAFAYLIGAANTIDFGNRGIYGVLYLTFPRRFVINTNDPWQGGDLGHTPPPGTGMDATTLQAINNWKGHSPGRGFFYTYDTNTWSYPVEFPPANTSSRGISGAGFHYPYNLGPNGALLAIVKKDSSFYYFWTDGF